MQTIILRLALALNLLPVFALAQFTISGRITDAEDTQALPNAHVILTPVNRVTFTDADGYYRLTDLPAGNYTLQVSLVGYGKQSTAVSLSQNATVHLTLEKSTLLADEVIVSATRVSGNAPTTYTNISRAQIEERNFGQDLPFLLDQTPSTVVTSDAGAGVGYTGIRIRGSDPTRVNVTINGIPLNDSESQGTFWVNMPDFASSVDNIQIQRGVGTSTNGAGAFGASINIQTSSLNPEAYGEVNNTFGSFNTWKHTLRLGSGLINGKWAFDGRLSKISSDGYIDRASSDLKSFYVTGGYYGKRTIVRANIFSGHEVTYQAWGGVPESMLGKNRTYNPYTYDNEVDNYQQDHYQLIFSHELNKRLNLNAALHYTRGRGYYEQFRENDRFASYGLPVLQIGDSLITRTDLIRRRWLDNHFFGLTYSANYTISEKLNTTLGGAWNRYDGDHFGEIIWARFASSSNIRDRYYDNNAWKTDFNAFAKATYELAPRLNAFADLQYRRVEYSFLGFNNFLENVQQAVVLNFFNPKGGLSYDLSENTNLYASYSIGNREPTRDDYTQSTPQSRPQAETLRNLEAGYRKRTSRYTLAANYYLMDYKNQLVLTGQINDVGAYTRTNIPRSYRTGIELEGSVRLLRRLSWSANATLSRNRIRNYREFIDNYDSGEQQVNEYRSTDIAFSPNLIAASTLTYSPVNNLNVNLVSKYVGEQFLDNTSNPNRRLNDFFVNDIRIQYVLKPAFLKEISFNLLVNNVFNVLYEPNGYTFSYVAGGEFTTENYYYPQAGTNFLAAVNLRF